MPTRETIPILLPRAMSRAGGNVGIRRHSMDVFANRANWFREVQIERFDYAPRWAQVQATVYRSGLEVERIYGADGVIQFSNLVVTDREEIELALENRSIDTDVRFTLHTQGWQHGEI